MVRYYYRKTKNGILLNKEMRIWSLHQQYIETKGLVALWQETFLSKHVLEGQTKGYKNNPQLIRF